MNNMLSTPSQILALQQALTVSISQHQDLNRMLPAFMETISAHLNLQSIHIHFYKQSHLFCGALSDASGYLSFPQQATITPDDEPVFEKVLQLFTLESQAQIFLHEKHQFFLAHRLLNIGHIILIKHDSPVEKLISRSLIPVFECLAFSCIAYFERQALQHEIESRKKAERELIRQTAFDALTSLPNRKTLNEMLSFAISEAMRHDIYGAVFFMDVDKFKQINDSHGHSIGDKYLKVVAARLQTCVRTDDILARTGGDEFVIAVMNLSYTEKEAIASARILAEQILGRMNRPIEIDGIYIDIDISIGIAMFPSDIELNDNLQKNCDALMCYADSAMYRVKTQQSNGYEFFSAEMQVARDRRLLVEQKLRKAISKNEFKLHFQPIVDIDGRIIAAESLLRWENEKLGSVTPDEFIEIAEESGLILDIGEWVLRETCAMILAVKRIFGANLEYISVNISARQLKQADFVDTVLSTLAQYDIPARMLQLEITETATIDDIENSVEKIKVLKRYGVHFSLDDFGTGYSSLSYLHMLPATILKIDRSFVGNISRNLENQVIVDAALAMASRLHMKCIAEGIENVEDVNYFKQHPIYGLQGSFFHSALAQDAFLQLLKDMPKTSGISGTIG